MDQDLPQGQEQASITQNSNEQILEQIEQLGINMNGWLKFLGVVNIISGALTAISVVGIIIAWLPIWLGVLLIQAGSRASNARFSKNRQELVVMVDKLRLYFIIQGILIIVSIAVALIGIFMFGAIFSRFFQGNSDF